MSPTRHNLPASHRDVLAPLPLSLRGFDNDMQHYSHQSSSPSNNKGTGSKTSIVHALQRLRKEQDNVIVALMEKDDMNQERFLHAQNNYALLQDDYTSLHRKYLELSKSTPAITQDLVSLNFIRRDLEEAQARNQRISDELAAAHQERARLQAENECLHARCQELEKYAASIQKEHDNCGPTINRLRDSEELALAQTKSLAEALRHAEEALEIVEGELGRVMPIIETANEFLHCDLCLRYNAKSGVMPVILPCGHMYCQECVEKWDEEQRRADLFYSEDIAEIEYSCPHCRARHNRPPASIYKAQNLMEELKPYAPPSPSISPRYLESAMQDELEDD